MTMPRIIRLLVLFCALSPAKAAFITTTWDPVHICIRTLAGYSDADNGIRDPGGSLPSGSDTFFGTYFYGGSSIDLSPELWHGRSAMELRTITGPGDGGLRFLIDDFGGILRLDMVASEPGDLEQRDTSAEYAMNTFGGRAPRARVQGIGPLTIFPYLCQH